MDVVEYLPPSARQVLLVLASCGPLTQKDIISKTDLPPRTVRYALDRLKGEEMLQERFCFSDARQSLYSLFGMDTKQML
jgi:DNA-binding MarR family transcriptional regulator